MTKITFCLGNRAAAAAAAACLDFYFFGFHVTFSEVPAPRDGRKSHAPRRVVHTTRSKMAVRAAE